MLSKRPCVVERYILRRVPDFESFDVVHVHYEASCSIAGIRLASRFNLPLVQTMHGREDAAIAVNVPKLFRNAVAGMLDWSHGKCLPHQVRIDRSECMAPKFVRAKMWELMSNHANQADIVLAPSVHFANDLKKYQVTKPVMVLSNGIPRDLVGTGDFCRELREGETLRMIWNSRVSKEKRILDFLKALRSVRRPYYVEIFGGGNVLGRAKRYARKYGLNVEFFGAVRREQLIERMREAHLCVMTSYGFDTQGMALLEAEAVGLPVFFCDPNLTETVPQGGYILANGPEAAQIAEALEKLSVRRIAEMSRVMLRHRDEVWQEVQTRKLLEIYRRAIGWHKYDTMET